MEVKTDSASIDATIASLPKGSWRIELGNYEDGTAWAYVWVNGRQEITGEDDGDSMAEALASAVRKATAG